MNVEEIKNSIFYCLNDIPEHDTKPIYCVWSGGCDSTAVLFQLLNNIPEKPIHTIAFNHHQIGEYKMQMEKQKRTEFLCWCESHEKFRNRIKHTDINLSNISVEISNENGCSCPQPFLWTTNILTYVLNDSLIAFGYHKGDDFFTYDIFSNWLKLCEGATYLLGKKVSFFMPYRYSEKVDIIRILKENNIYDFTWYCEGNRPDKTACGYCLPCKTHEAACYMYKIDKERCEKSFNDIIEVAKDLESIDPAPRKEVKTIDDPRKKILARAFGDF